MPRPNIRRLTETPTMVRIARVVNSRRIAIGDATARSIARAHAAGRMGLKVALCRWVEASSVRREGKQEGLRAAPSQVELLLHAGRTMLKQGIGELPHATMRSRIDDTRIRIQRPARDACRKVLSAKRLPGSKLLFVVKMAHKRLHAKCPWRCSYGNAPAG